MISGSEVLDVDVSVAVRGLDKGYGGNRVIQGLDLELRPGVTGLLGPNGAGKTTLLRCLATVLAFDAGTIEILGMDASAPAQLKEIRRRLGYLPQEPGLYPHFTAAQTLDYIAILKEITDRRGRAAEVARVLSEVDLSDRAGTAVRKLSGGMRQRLGIAQALLGDPDVVIMDEPTVGLDPEQRMRFRALTSRLGESRAVLLSTHQTEDIAALCERVVVFNRGRVVFEGTPAELAGLARGKVWSSTVRPASGDVFWRTTDGRFRVVGPRPEDGEPAEPTVEDGYLICLNSGVGSRP